MMIGVQKSLSHPLGLGLGSSGPAYRYVENLQNMDKEIVDRKDIENIPESWYIQQFVE